MNPQTTILIPAHDEEASIARTLAPLSALAGEDAWRVIVICNGCRDATAAVARAALPSATVIEQDDGGKWRAINAGLEMAPPGSAIILDADIEIDLASLRALAAALEQPEVRAVSPAARFALDPCDSWVRAYYRVFSRHGYLRHGVGGAGVYGLSAAARQQLGPLPPLISDDGFVRAAVAMENQRRVTQDAAGGPVFALVHPPRHVGELVRSEARWRRGDRELDGAAMHDGVHSGGLGSLIRDDRPGMADLLRYMAIKAAGRLLAAVKPVRADRRWRKDMTSRQQ